MRAGIYYSGERGYYSCSLRGDVTVGGATRDACWNVIERHLVSYVLGQFMKYFGNYLLSCVFDPD